MESPVSNDPSELLQWVVIIVTAVGVGAQHYWALQQNVVHRSQDQFEIHIARPSNDVINYIDQFNSDITTYLAGEKLERTMRVKHALLVRKINTFTSQCIAATTSSGDAWREISTRDLEQRISDETGDSLNALERKSILADLDRIKYKIQSTVTENRP